MSVLFAVRRNVLARDPGPTVVAENDREIRSLRPLVALRFLEPESETTETSASGRILRRSVRYRKTSLGLRAIRTLLHDAGPDEDEPWTGGTPVPVEFDPEDSDEHEDGPPEEAVTPRGPFECEPGEVVP